MSAPRVIEAVNVFEDGDLRVSAGLPRMLPDQLRLGGFEEGFHRRIVIAISFATHGSFEAMLLQ